LVTLVAAVRPVVVWHLATRFTSTHAVDDVEPLVRDNILFGAQLLEAMSRSGARSLVVAGSAWQQHDNADYAPVSLYAATKQAFEAMAAWYAEVRDLRVVVTRLSDVYGPGDTRRKLVWALAEAERTGNALPMNDGSPYIDLLHVDDAVAALRVAGDRAVARAGGMEHWAVRGGRSMPLRELVALWQQVRGTTFPVQWGALPLRAREATTPWTAGDVLPEWMPAIRLEDGLRGL
jgi:nucleoside-diphosphate-sugar epimerase